MIDAFQAARSTRPRCRRAGAHSAVMVSLGLAATTVDVQALGLDLHGARALKVR